MIIRRIISGFRPTPFVMRQVWFNCNRVLNRFEFIFLNMRRVQVLLLQSCLDYILKIFVYYFILYFNINNNNNN